MKSNKIDTLPWCTCYFLLQEHLNNTSSKDLRVIIIFRYFRLFSSLVAYSLRYFFVYVSFLRRSIPVLLQFICQKRFLKIFFFIRSDEINEHMNTQHNSKQTKQKLGKIEEPNNRLEIRN